MYFYCKPIEGTTLSEKYTLFYPLIDIFNVKLKRIKIVGFLYNYFFGKNVLYNHEHVLTDSQEVVISVCVWYIHSPSVFFLLHLIGPKII